MTRCIYLASSDWRVRAAYSGDAKRSATEHLVCSQQTRKGSPYPKFGGVSSNHLANFGTVVEEDESRHSLDSNFSGNLLLAGT